MWRPSSSGRVTCLSETLWSSLCDLISAVERSFRARIGESGPCTCRQHGYKASGTLGCNVATLIFRAGHLPVRDTVELSLLVFPEHISAVERSFRAQIGLLGPCTCCLHSYKASGSL